MICAPGSSQESGYHFTVETETTTKNDLELWLSLCERDAARDTAFEIKTADKQMIGQLCCRHLAPPSETEYLSRIRSSIKGVFDRTSEGDCLQSSAVSVPDPVG